MSRAEDLLREATPLPWKRHGYARISAEVEDVEMGGMYHDADAALIVYAVNRLPAYEAAVEAAGLLADCVRRYFDEGQTKAVVNMQPLVERIESELARLLEPTGFYDNPDAPGNDR